MLGPPAVRLSTGQAPAGLRASKCVALLAFLALQPGPHSREELAALLWGDSSEGAARASLRQALKQLRETVGDVVRADRSAVELTGPVTSDVQEFLRVCEAEPAQAGRFDPTRFLDGLAVHNAPAFEEWAERKRAMLRQRFAEALRALAREAIAGSHWREAAAAADRWLECDPYAEEAARLGAEAEYMAGDRAAALARLAGFRQRLEREAKAEASAELIVLARRIESGRQAGEPRRAAGESQDSVPSFHAPLVGREREWRTLMDVWEAIRAGAGKVVFIEGEVGLGKTRLAQDFANWARAEGATVLTGRGHDPKTGIPYGPVVEVLREALNSPGTAATAPEWLTEVTRLLPELRRLYPGLPEPSAPVDAAERWRLFEGVTQVLLSVAAERPTVVLIDDLQWCDGETCALLQLLARRIETAPVALVTTVRLGELESETPAARLCRSLRVRSQVVSVPVRALSAEEVWLLIKELGGVRSPTAGRRLAARVHEVTDGNPFHAIELLKTLFSQRLLIVDPATGEWKATRADHDDPARSEFVPMPPTVRDAIGERLSRLPYELHDLLAAVAVSGSGARADVLSHVFGISRLRAAALCDALGDRLLVIEEDGVYQCAHPVIAEVVRGRLTRTRRRELHRALALALEAVTPSQEMGAVAPEIARHAERGRERGMTYYYALQASEEAVRRYAFEEALSWLELSEGASEPGEQVEAVQRRKAEILGRAGWSEPPRRSGRPGTPARGIAQIDLDLA